MADSDEFDGLEGFFRAARAAAPEPSAALLDRIAADAAAETARRGAQAVPARRPAGHPVRGGFWHLLVPALGGPGVLAGLAGAMVAGAWIGIVQPAPIAGLTAQVTETVAGGGDTIDQVDLIPALNSYFADAPGE